jgi:hypothetical protein
MTSKGKTILLGTALVIAAAANARAADMPVKAPQPAAPAPLFIVNGNSVGYYYAFTATNSTR